MNNVYFSNTSNCIHNVIYQYGFDGNDIPTGFKNHLYRVLIVCNKFQTGFDEPLLHSIFIDKSLQGVQCVQTLSRLNRKTRGKKDTFVLDFVNNVETIQESFQNFYQTTILSENLVYDILDKVRNYGLFSPQEVDDWNIIYFSKNRDDSKLQTTLNSVLTRWEELDLEKRDLSRSQISNYCKLYRYLSMIHQFNNLELEKQYIFFEYIRRKFPVEGLKGIDVSDLIDLESLNLDIKGKMNISLEEKDTQFEPHKYGDGKSRKEEEFDLLSQILNEINEYYGKPPEGTEESSKKLLNDIVNDEDFKKVILPNRIRKIKFRRFMKIKILRLLIQVPNYMNFSRRRNLKRE